MFARLERRFKRRPRSDLAWRRIGRRRSPPLCRSAQTLAGYRGYEFLRTFIRRPLQPTLLMLRSHC